MIEVPPTTLRMFSWPYTPTDDAWVRQQWQMQYVENGVRPCVHQDEVVMDSHLVGMAVYLGIPLIEVRIT